MPKIKHQELQSMDIRNLHFLEASYEKASKFYLLSRLI